MSMKTVKLDNWSCCPIGFDPWTPPELYPMGLQGNAYGHPKFEDGNHIVTTKVHKIEGRKITTRNTVYILGKIDPGYRKWLRKERPNWDWRNPITDLRSES